MLFDTLRFIPRTKVSYFVVLLLGAAVYIAFMIQRLRRYYNKAYKRWHYYWKCYAAYGIFILISMLVHTIFGRAVYAWLFCITMFVEYTNFDLPLFGSTAVFHSIMLAVIALAPIQINLHFLTRNPSSHKYKHKHRKHKKRKKEQ